MKSLQMVKNFHSIIKRRFLYQILTCITFCGIVVMIFVILNSKIEVNNFRKYTLIEDIKLMNSVDSLEINKNSITLYGYAFHLDNDSINSSISIFLRNLKNNDEVWMDIETLSRNDVQEYFDSDYNYLNTGYLATARQNNIELDEAYEIILNLDITNEKGIKNRKTVSTKRYIYKGELLDYNPYDFDIPDTSIQSETLRRVFTDGKLHFYRRDVGLYLYEYQNKLYWIATKDFDFNIDGQTYIPYEVMTSQINKLPEHNIQHKYDFLDFIFENYEFSYEITEPYRVTVRDIPNSYPITYINTGVYNVAQKTWIWKESFQLGLR